MLVLQEGAAFSLKNSSTGLFLGVDSNAGYAGANIVAVHVSQQAIPRWFWRKEQHAHYVINENHPNMCLNVAYESKNAGANLQQWYCNGGSSELWDLERTSNGNFLLINQNSGLAVGPSHLRDGSPIVQLTSTDTALAQWDLISLEDEGSQLSMVEMRSTPNPPVCDSPIFAPTLADETIYNIYVPIYSGSGTLRSVTQDLSRIAGFGFSTILIMPMHPIGVPTGKHPAVDSPYAVADFYAISPALGQLSDFADLVCQAHALGIKVIMDVVLNHTAWNHPLIKQSPHFYVHTDNHISNINSIAQAFWFEDVAQLDYKCGSHVRDYMIDMLKWWMQHFAVDGFRFDTVDNPSGHHRMVPAHVWTVIGQVLRNVHPSVILLGECTNPNLSLAPFNIDYTNYSLQPAVASAVRSQDAKGLKKTFEQLKSEHPSGMLHTSIMQTWDMDLDLRMYGGPDGTMAAAVFNFTIQGVPMIFAGEEVANNRGGINTHAHIDWNGPLAPRFRNFYSQLGMLRRKIVALRRGDTKWLKTKGGGSGLIAFLRKWNFEQCMIAINFSASATQAALKEVTGDAWTEVTPEGALRSTPHPAPPSVHLGSWDFAIFVNGGVVGVS